MSVVKEYGGKVHPCWEREAQVVFLIVASTCTASGGAASTLTVTNSATRPCTESVVCKGPLVGLATRTLSFFPNGLREASTSKPECCGATSNPSEAPCEASEIMRVATAGGANH